MKRKVLIIVENLPVPFDSRVWKEAQTLKNNGYKVFVICPKGKHYFKKYEKIEGVHIYRHSMPKEGENILGYLFEYNYALFCELFLAIKIFIKHRFHVIQACNPPDNIFLVALFFKIFGVKFIFDHHDANPELYYAKFGRKDFLYQLQILLERFTYKVCNVAITTNKSYKNIAIKRNGMVSKNVFIVRNGPELEKYKPLLPNKTFKYGKKYLIGYVGNMNKQDGIDFLLKVAFYFKNIGYNDVHFTCIGGGPNLKKLKVMKTKMELDNLFNFTGRISDDEMLEILSTADICVNPDTPNEMNNISTMIKVMEYMALSKPIIQFDLKEGRYSARDAALYVKNYSVEDFAQKILWLIDHPDERKKMGEFGRKRVEKKLAWNYSVTNYLKAYDRVLNCSAPDK